METTKRNEAIALFMNVDLYVSKDNKTIDYSARWDFLMPVVEKIEVGEGYLIEIVDCRCEIQEFNHDYENWKTIIFHLCKTKIEAVFMTVSDFCLMHNQQNSIPNLGDIRKEIETMEDRWIKFQDFDFTDEKYKTISVDTRDFHVIGQDEIYFPVNQEILSEDYYFTPKQAKKMIQDLFERSGGESDWRMLSFEGYGEWVKYLRIHRYEKGLVFTNNNRDSETKIAYSKEFLNGDIDYEHLCMENMYHLKKDKPKKVVLVDDSPTIPSLPFINSYPFEKEYLYNPELTKAQRIAKSAYKNRTKSREE